MKLLARLAIGLSLMVTTTAHADTVTQTVYEGTIGKSPVVVELRSATVKGKTVHTGQYYYKRYRTLIALEPGSGPLTFNERPGCGDMGPDCPITGALALKSLPTGLSGLWTAKGKKTSAPVALKAVATRTLTSSLRIAQTSDLYAVDDTLNGGTGELARNDPFRARRVNQDSVYGPEVRVGPIAYHTVTDKVTGVHYLQLTQHPVESVRDKVNAALDVERFYRVESALDCLSQSGFPGTGTTGGFEEMTDKVVYLSPTIMAVESAGSTFCGGAHPNNSWTITMYDLKKGGYLSADQLLALYVTPPGWAPGDERPETPAFKALKARLTPKSPWFVGDRSIPECLADDLGYDCQTSFNDKGLVFSRSDLPHVMGACMGEYYVVPYAELKALWRPEAKTYFSGL
jgi:hypothetical protein